MLTTTEPPLTYLPPTSATPTPDSNTTQDPQGYSTTGLLSTTETSVTTALSNASFVPYNSSHAPQWTSSAFYTSMSSTTTCCKKTFFFFFFFISRLLKKTTVLIYKPKKWVYLRGNTYFHKNVFILSKVPISSLDCWFNALLYIY